ncbi:Activating signal cointegrator 1, partial [Dufourea novaeangliae]
RYIMKIRDEKELDEYLMCLLDRNDVKHMQFIAELKKRQVSACNSNQGYQKSKDTDIEHDYNTNTKMKKRNKKPKKDEIYKQPQENIHTEKVEHKKTKYTNLLSQEGKDKTAILLKGRHKCNCEAQEHSLINNCLNCGRIVCTQEGAGPCFFCGQLVCSPKDQIILSSNKKSANQLLHKLMNQKSVKSTEDSFQQRDKLLEYDRIGTQGTKVIDDECDYYQTSNIWLPAKQREHLQKLEEEKNAKKYMSRLNKKVNVTFDFTGRQVVEEKLVNDYDEFNEEQFIDNLESLGFNECKSSNICPDIEFDRPIYIESNETKPRALKTTVPIKMKTILQDKEYLEMSDAGVCLSMHQPYASLLVAGIKMHEGRVWYTSHRGRLWIAATSKSPTTDDILTMEHFYRSLKDEKIQFPQSYPTSCLLGCVTVTDVLPQEEYRNVYPNGESDSPFVFICENFHTLPIQFPIQGKHKIYKLDQKIHQAAVKILQKLEKNTRD